MIPGYDEEEDFYYNAGETDPDYVRTSSSEASDELSIDDAAIDELNILGHDAVYFETFEDESGWFRSTFPELYLEDDSGVITDLVTGATPQGLPASLATASDAPVAASAPPSKSKSSPPPVPDETAATTGRPEQLLREGELRLKDSPVTKAAPEARVVQLTIPTDNSWNRKYMQEVIAGLPLTSAVPSSSVYVGYIRQASIGVAALIGNDRAHAEALLADPALQPYNPQILSAADEALRPYMKEEKVKASSGAPAPPPNPPRIRHVNIAVNADLFRHVLQERGGLSKVRFVVIDVEAAVVHQGSMPQPLEVSVVAPEGHEVHMFTHPGVVTDDRTAMMLSCCMANGGHGIPFKNSRFLRQDYGKIWDDLRPLVLDPHTILICKGESNLDSNALRVLCAAALDGTESHIPDLFVFDADFVITTLSQALGQSECPVLPSKRLAGQTVSRDDLCWYHKTAVEHFKGVTITQSAPAEDVETPNAEETDAAALEWSTHKKNAHERLHCAQGDARVLFTAFSAALSEVLAAQQP